MTAASPGGALKAWLDAPAQSLGGVKVFVRYPPKDQALPYVVIQEGISAVVEGRDDGGRAAGGSTLVSDELQIDLYMYEEDPVSGSLTEDLALPYKLAQVLDGAALGSFGAPPIRIYQCQLIDGPRELGDPSDPNVIRKTYAVTLRRET